MEMRAGIQIAPLYSMDKGAVEFLRKIRHVNK